VNDAIWKIAEERGLDMVFDTVSGNIVYANVALDITDLVLEELEQ
jgi:Skp family chaperone for outer membrane proteins